MDVGDFLRFKSCILYTELENADQPLINVEVVAHVTRPEVRSSEVSSCLTAFEKTKGYLFLLYRGQLVFNPFDRYCISNDLYIFFSLK